LVKDLVDEALHLQESGPPTIEKENGYPRTRTAIRLLGTSSCKPVAGQPTHV